MLEASPPGNIEDRREEDPIGNEIRNNPILLTMPPDVEQEYRRKKKPPK